MALIFRMEIGDRAQAMLGSLSTPYTEPQGQRRAFQRRRNDRSIVVCHRADLRSAAQVEAIADEPNARYGQ